MTFSLKIYLIYIIMQMAMYYKHFLKLYFKGIITIASTIFEDEKTVVQEKQTEHVRARRH